MGGAVSTMGKGGDLPLGSSRRPEALEAGGLERRQSGTPRREVVQRKRRWTGVGRGQLGGWEQPDLFRTWDQRLEHNQRRHSPGSGWSSSRPGEGTGG